MCLLWSVGLLWSCATGAGVEKLRARAAFDFNCPERDIEIFELDERTSGVRACGQQGTYVETCDSPYKARETCTWVLNADSSEERPEREPEPAPPTQAAPAAPPAASVVSANGVVRAVPMGEGVALRLAGRPAQNGGQALLRLSLVGEAPQSASSWENCSEAHAVADDKSFAIQNVKLEKQGFAGAVTLTGSLRVGELIHVAKAERDASIIVCGQRSVIEPSSRRVVLTFLQDFKRAALQSGTWDPSLAPEAPAPSAAE